MTVNRMDEVMKKLEKEKILNKILKSRKTFEKHLNAASDAYIATGAWLDAEGTYDSNVILDEIRHDLQRALLRYDFAFNPFVFMGNLIEERAELQRVCRRYARSQNSSRSRSAKKKAKKMLENLELKEPVEKYMDDLDSERATYLEKQREEREDKRRIEKARAAEKKYWKKTPVKKDFQLNRVGKYIDGSDAKKNFLENRVQNHFAEVSSLGIEEPILKELTMYYNGCIQEPDDSRGNTIVKDTKIIMKKELARLGVPEHYVRSLMAKLDSLRKDYQAQKVAFYSAYNNAPVEN